MKKAIIVLMIIFTVVISSCKKDDNSNTNNLAGTTWVCNISSDGRNYIYTMKFTSSTVCTLNMAVEGVAILYTGTYTYEPPMITIELKIDGDTTSISGTINGNSMTLTDDGDTIVFNKQ